MEKQALHKKSCKCHTTVIRTKSKERSKKQCVRGFNERWEEGTGALHLELSCPHSTPLVTARFPNLNEDRSDVQIRNTKGRLSLAHTLVLTDYCFFLQLRALVAVHAGTDLLTQVVGRGEGRSHLVNECWPASRACPVLPSAFPVAGAHFPGHICSGDP